jgi:hypothetical protein
MAVEEPRRIALHRAAADSWGEEVADTLLDLVVPSGHEPATREDIRAVLAAMSAMDERLTERITAMDERVGALEQLSEERFRAMEQLSEERFGTMEQRFGALDERLTAMEQRWQTEMRGMRDALIGAIDRRVADAVLAAPLTFTTLNKWATGMADTVAVGILCELLGAPVPITAIPCVKRELRNHPAYQASVDVLSGSGVTFLDSDPLTYRDASGLAAFRWKMVAEKVAPGTVG